MNRKYLRPSALPEAFSNVEQCNHKASDHPEGWRTADDRGRWWLEPVELRGLSPPIRSKRIFQHLKVRKRLPQTRPSLPFRNGKE